MAKTKQGASLDRKKLMADPIMMTTIVLLITFLTLFILYPLAMLLVDSGENFPGVIKVTAEGEELKLATI